MKTFIQKNLILFTLLSTLSVSAIAGGGGTPIDSGPLRYSMKCLGFYSKKTEVDLSGNFGVIGEKSVPENLSTDEYNLSFGDNDVQMTVKSVQISGNTMLEMTILRGNSILQHGYRKVPRFGISSMDHRQDAVLILPNVNVDDTPVNLILACHVSGY